MSLVADDDTTIVSRLRVRYSTTDLFATQLRAGNVLSRADWRPQGIPRSAIFCINKLHDPLPGSLRLHGDSRTPVAWQQALETKLNQLAIGAVRPVLTVVPPTAEAVVFMDRSELLAAAASDWCEAQLPTNWWWRSLMKGAEASQVVLRLWRESPEFIPAAMQHLANRRKVEAFVKKLSGDEALDLLRRVVLRFGLQAETTLWTTEFAAPDSGSEQIDGNKPSANKRTPDIRFRSNRVAHPPWSGWVPEAATEGLGSPQQRLLALSLMLQRAPGTVRSSRFAAALRDWQRQSASSTAAPEIESRTDTVVDALRIDISPVAVRQLRTHDSAQPTDSGDSAAKSRLVDLHADTSRSSKPTSNTLARESSKTPAWPSKQVVSDIESKDKLVTQHQTRAASEVVVDRVRPHALLPLELHDLRVPGDLSTATDQRNDVATTNLAMVDEPLISRSVASTFDQDLVVPIETQFGGVFYLINLAHYLELYGDFSTPHLPGIRLNIWDFVALVGRELIGKQLQRDPVWKLLQRLAGREDHEAPGVGFESENEWRVPAAWLHAFAAENEVRWTIRGQRLWAFHALGFRMLDLPVQSGDPAQQLERELAAYADFNFRVSRLRSAEFLTAEKRTERRTRGIETSPEVRIWLDRLMPYIRARLRKALGLRARAVVASAWWRQHASVAVRPAHLDITIPLAELPVKIRLAGLDRNPGWVPAAGKFMEFHFE